MSLIVPVKKHQSVKVTNKNRGILEAVHNKFKNCKLMDRVKGTQFEHFFDAPKLKFSGTIVHAMLLRQINSTADDELQFKVGSKKCRFGLMEFALITGLNFGDPPSRANRDVSLPREGLKQKYFSHCKNIHLKDLCSAFNRCTNEEDVYRLGLCCFVEGYLFSSEAKSSTFPDLISLADDVNDFINYPWGHVCFKRTLASLKNFKENKTYTVYGLAASLQYWAYEAIYELGVRYGTKVATNEKFPRMLKWKSSETVLFKDIFDFLKRKSIVISLLTPDNESEREFVQTIKCSARIVRHYNLHKSQVLVGDELAAQEVEEAAREAARRAARRAARAAQIEEKGIFNVMRDVDPHRTSPRADVPDAPPVFPSTAGTSVREAARRAARAAQIAREKGIFNVMRDVDPHRTSPRADVPDAPPVVPSTAGTSDVAQASDAGVDWASQKSDFPSTQRTEGLVGLEDIIEENMDVQPVDQQDRGHSEDHRENADIDEVHFEGVAQMNLKENELPLLSLRKNRTRAESANGYDNLEENNHWDDRVDAGVKSPEKRVKKVLFDLNNNLTWMTHNPMPSQNLRIPPSAAPRGSALKKGVPPGPIIEVTTSPENVARKKGRKIAKTIFPAPKRLKRVHALSVT